METKIELNTTHSAIIEKRITIIKGLFELCKTANCETYFMDTLMDGIADGDEPTLGYFATDKEFNRLLNLYLTQCAIAAQDGGFYGLRFDGTSTTEIDKDALEPYDN